MKKLIQPLFNPYIGPIIVISFIVAYLVAFIIPTYSLENKKEQMTQKAVNTINNLKKTRSYYTNNVINDVKKSSNLKINYDHDNKEDTIPLPATLVHDLSNILTEENMEIKMYSNYPFPNRKDRVLSKHEKQSLSWLINNPNKTFTRTITQNNKKVFKVAVSDVFYNESCVQCHNTRADTPKNDWEIGDVRGIIEVSLPIKEGFILSGKQTIYMIATLIVFILALGIHYTVISYIRQKDYKKNREKLEKEVQLRTKDLKDSNILLNQYKKAVDTSAIVSKTNKKGIITYVNEEFMKISKYSQEELIGKNHNIIRHPEMSNEFFKNLWDTLNSKKIWKGKIKNKAKDGTVYYVASTIVPILNSNNEIEEFLAIRLDITDVINSQIKAQRADQAKSTFLANISHEIRTPLNAIIGFSSILCKSKNLDISSKKQANIIQTSANSLLGIINDILDISKIESGNFEMAIENTDIYYVSEHVVELFSKRAVEKHLKLIFNLDHKVPLCIQTDGVRIRQVLSNLLSNAIKFTPEHGKVYLNITQVKLENNISTIRFEVVDTGIGIPKEKLENVFKPFVQIDHKSNRQFEGTGLGLSICTHIVESLGSKINIESEVGTGTKFWFDLSFNTCDDFHYSTRQKATKINFIIDDSSSDLYHYAKRYLMSLGTINQNQSDANSVHILTKKDISKDDLKQHRKSSFNTSTLVLFEYEDNIDKLDLKDNEKAIALPFYASKINDAIQELQSLSSSMTCIENEDSNESFNANILVAEDNIANQELISYILQEFNLDFDLAKNGKEAFELFVQNSYDIVLMDINMPIMDGIESFNKIKEYENSMQLHHTPIVALTANAIKGDKEKFLSMGMDDYLSKPINTDELKTIFKKFVIDKQLDSKNSDETQQTALEEEITVSPEVVASKLGVSQTIANMIINKFKEEIHNDLKELETYIQKDEIENRANKAHYIKNSCLNLALDDICELLQKLEDKELSNNDVLKYFDSIYNKLNTMANK
ncbi:MAG: ATP-binding protein [Campylobacterota bacterium]